MKIQLDSDELKAAISAWLLAEGYRAASTSPMTLSADGIVTVDIGSVVGQGATPAAASSPDPGAPYSLKCIATHFGYNDPGDDGNGAWGTNTNNTTVVGVAVPIPILIATLGGVTVDHIKGYTVSVICLDTGKFKPTIDIVDDGPGDSVDGQHGLLVGKNGVLHALDMTAGLCAQLGVKYDPVSGGSNVVWWICDPSGKPVAMKGLDAPKKIV